MAAGSTYTPIATQTLGSAAASVTFSSIPGTYTDLVVVINNTSVSTNTAAIVCQVNGDTASNYSFTELYGDGTTAYSYRLTNSTVFSISTYNGGLSSTVPGTTIANFQNYSNTTTYKTFVSKSGAANTATAAVVGLWRSTAVINSITFSMQSTFTMGAGSTFTLYGIKAA